MLKEINNLQFGDFILCPALRELRQQNQLLPVAGKAFDLLVYMAANPGRPLTKSELLEAVWPETSVEEANLSQNVFLLRKILGSGTNSPIKTLPGLGYQFAAHVTAPVTAITAAAAPANFVPSAGSTVLETTHTRVVLEAEFLEAEFEAQFKDHLHQRLSSLVVPVAVLLAIAIGGWFGWQHWLDRSQGEPVQLVFTGLDGTTGDSILDRALADALRMDLAQSPFVSTVSASTVRSTLTQMMHKPDDPITPAIARDICERTNSQAILHGSIARSGSHYLVTAEASNCVNESAQAAAKFEAAKAEDLPRGVDRIAETLRRNLGESRRSIARFSGPLMPANTASLDALKAYSQSLQMAAQGNIPQAINLLKQAVAGDPGFAIAWNDLYAYYTTSDGGFLNARDAIQKAYALRDTASPVERLTITAHYNQAIVGDLYETERNYRNWTQLYPRSIVGWNGLSLTQGELGKYPDAAISAARALALRPTYVGLSANLAIAQTSAGQLQAAKATCEHALAQGLDGDHLRTRYLALAYLLKDAALIQSQRTWSAAHPDATSTSLTDGNIAMAEGRFNQAHQIIDRSFEAMRRQGLGSLADSLTRSTGIGLIEAGDIETGTRMLRSSTADPESGYDLVGLAEVGDVAGASAGLHSMLSAHPQFTLWQHYWAPQIQAAIATTNHQPDQAARFLADDHSLDGRSLDLPMHRGNALLASGQPALAEQEFRFVLAHQQVDPVSYWYPLSWLGLGRALSAQNKAAAAQDAYQHFFKLWAHADPDSTYLKLAKSEYSALQARKPKDQ